MAVEIEKTSGSLPYDIYGVNAEGLIPFKIFRERSTQKAACAQVLGVAIEEQINGSTRTLKILDIGAGDATLVNLATSHLPGFDIETHLLEPGSEMFAAMWPNIAQMKSRGIAIKVVPDKWDEHKVTPDYYNVILCSHAYDIPDAENLKMAEALKQGGLLFFVRRREDEVFQFAEYFSDYAGFRPSRAMLLDNVVQSFSQYAPHRVNISMQFETSESELEFPNPEMSPAEFHALVEFILVTPWQQIPPEVQEGITQYLREREWKLKLTEGIMIIKRLPNKNNHNGDSSLENSTYA